ncbi:MAG: magnesium transporter [Candidatus ainarchaeum sp.]|nr:magnesium transporter [Candidatus ainarchaeum sp.]
MHNGYLLPNQYVDQVINGRDYCAEFLKVPVELRGVVFLYLPQTIQKQVLKKISDEKLVDLLRYPDPDDITDIIQGLSFFRRKKILSELEGGMAKKVADLLAYPSDTAIRLTNLDYVLVDLGIKFKDVLNVVEKHKKKTGKDPVVLAQKDGIFVGEIPVSAFIRSNLDDIIDKYVVKVPTIFYHEKQSKIIKLFEHNKHNKIIVLDKGKAIIGIIYSDDVFRLMKKQRARDLYGFAGLKQEEDIFDKFYIKIKNRATWLVLNLFTAFLASLVVALFKDVISAVVVLAAYMPIVAGMGGNAGTQTLAVTVRGLVLHNIEKRAFFRIYFNELLAAFFNGLIVGIVAIVLAYLLGASLVFSLIVAVSVLLNLMVAVSAGFFVPLFLKRIGKDPATGSSVLITTATDVCGFFIFLGLASIIFL